MLVFGWIMLVYYIAQMTFFNYSFQENKGLAGDPGNVGKE